jgi:hypothetical protein
MRAKSHRSKRAKNSSQMVQMIAHAELPTRYGRFTIYGFKGRGPQEEAVALVRGNLKGRTAPLVSVTRPLSSAVFNCANDAVAVRRISAPRKTFRRKSRIPPPNDGLPDG